jgi:phosphohistidine phosphatase
MKTVLLMRHAKSSWKDDARDDHNRPLNKRGKKEAPRMGQLLRDEHLLPDLIVSSDAKRCRRTVEKICEAMGYHGDTILTGELYLAPPASYIKILQHLPDHVGRVLLVGHNPGLEELLETFIQRYEPLTTAALAHLEFAAIERWSQFEIGTHGELIKLWQPMELP